MRTRPKQEPETDRPVAADRLFRPMDVPSAEQTGNPVHRYQNDLAARMRGGPGLGRARGARFAPSAIVTVPVVAAGVIALMPITVVVAAGASLTRGRDADPFGDVSAAARSLFAAFRATTAVLARR